MLAGLAAAFAKDLRLLARDRVGLAFLTLAPIVVITVAGLSLATLYGAEPRGGTAPVLPLADEDGGWVGRAVRERLADEPSVRVRPVAAAAAARALVQAKRAAAALVVPAGTSEAVGAGRAATLVLFTDPVKTVDVAYVRSLAQELRHGLEAGAVERAQQDLDAARAQAADTRARVVRAADELHRALDDLRTRLEVMRAEAERRRAAAERELRTAQAAARARLSAVLVPLRAFMAELAARRQAFAEWLATVRERAGRYADRVPPPPEPPSVPPALEELTSADPDAVAARLVAPDGAAPTLPPLAPPAPPALPVLDLPSLPEPPAGRLPGPLALEETSVTGAPRRFNTFDQNVPGFGVTFLLLGVLFGVSLGLLDEREWGTFERVRATPMGLTTVLLAKLGTRAAAATVQMALLFLVGRLAFGVSLGPEPWALLLPTAGIVFAGTAFGLVVAALAPSREAVMALGSMAIMTMAAVGGCWWPIDLEPDWMRRAALAFPTTWAMEAYNDLMIRRQPAGAALGATAVLLAYGAGYLAAGLLLFRRRVLRAA
ncbi:MAG TPA: ABC transporter permease [Verrucomicrobiae bacterium]|nr:ABC transporter permease [Verrucomicrobiae bacterium]